MRSKLMAAWVWFRTTSTVIGLPVTILLALLFVQKVTWTTTCHVAGFNCEYAIGATDAMVAFMGDLIQANDGRDIQSVPAKRR